MNRTFITSYDNESVTVIEKDLQISRKNREEVLKAICLEGVFQLYPLSQGLTVADVLRSPR